MKRLIAFFSLLLLTACDQTPTGREQLALVPEAMMARFGSQTFLQMQQQLTVNDDPAPNHTVECVARTLLTRVSERFPGAPMPDTWEIVVFDDPTPNAFALPGGKIGVNRGLLKVATSQDQLATVIGHEIAHVLARHGNERMTQQLGIKAVLFVVGLLSENDTDTESILQALGLGAHLGIALPFSRAHEEEADIMGLELMASAGFQPEQSVQLWRNMAEAAGGQPLEFLSTHPAHASRIQALSERLPEARRLYARAAPASCP